MRHLTLHQRVFEGQVIASVYQQLIFQMLWRMEVFAGRFLPIAASLMHHQPVLISIRIPIHSSSMLTLIES